MRHNIYNHNNDNTRILSSEELEGKNLYAVLEGHAVILKSPKNLDGIFGYGTHTCSLVIVEGSNGELGLVHVHELIGKDDLIKFFGEFTGIKKIHAVGGSEITFNLINDTTNELGILNTEYISGQHDAVVYREGNYNKINTTCKIPEIFIKDKVNEISSHISSWLYILFTEHMQNRKKGVPLIIENK